MACRSIGRGVSSFLQERRYRTNPTANLSIRSSQALFRKRSVSAANCRVVCRLSQPVSPKEERIPARDGGSDKLAEIGRSLLALSPIAEPLEVRRKEEASIPPSSPLTENFDRWMEESVIEIVQNIQEAPFFVCLYSRKKGALTNIERELVSARDRSWPKMKGWAREKRPDGIILVEELKDNAEDENPIKCSKLWGLLIQVGGIDCAACYILKTTRVCSALGLCTHFCLIRAKCFGDPVETQLRDSWLNLGL